MHSSSILIEQFLLWVNFLVFVILILYLFHLSFDLILWDRTISNSYEGILLFPILD